MNPNPNDKARRLAALEAAVASELTRTRTMTLAVACAGRPAELEPAVAAWIADWTEYHVGRAGNQVVRDALPVAIGEVSVPRVSAAVWIHYQQQWAELESSTSSEVMAQAAGGETDPRGEPGQGSQSREAPTPQLPTIRVPTRFSQRLKATIRVNGEQRKVPPSVARALLEIAEGAELVKFRKETHLAILRDLPEVSQHLVRLDDRKVINNKHVYRPSTRLREAIETG